MTIDLKNMDLKELKKLQKDAAKAIENFEDRKRQEALAAAREAVGEFGFKLEELVTGSGKKPKTKSVPKYAHPENSAKTWTGKGRRPAWVVAHVDGGGSLEDLAI
ncbi:H-NS histone family protein [Tateyamaria pelophila]|uniref:H-NS histone family protein n=1 Tax=Tateyamaria pelophila TaxID=328415 RepID=UPI001CBD0F33|nr:H-NS histone family protein [Tateyamaria pelophila]